MLATHFSKVLIEAGCDEAGRGCLAGPVFAAAVILPKKLRIPDLDDSKKITEEKRYELRKIIEEKAEAWAVASLNPKQIDKVNILNASFLAMHKAIRKLRVIPELLLIDGNRFTPYKNIKHKCIIKGDGKYTSIAAASILAKTYRDDYMKKLSSKFPEYSWQTNKGYPTIMHRTAIFNHGKTIHHRNSFKLIPDEWRQGIIE